MMTARELMTREVITISPSMDISAAARLLTGARITGAPVVDKDGVLVGVVSQTDLTRVMGGRRRGEGAYARGPVSKVMTKSVVTCDESAKEEDIAELMLRRHVHRVVVTCGAKLCGIVTAMDLLRALLRRSDDQDGPGDCFGRFARQH